ncbi:ABC transporter permease subunit [Dehalogenimonas sp. THU2]|uniref:ABC transporter permease subunit n=1 Tax=Dehalogenimonas sp. THU2 TaxID=3151121 RepID=UPI003218633B
MNIFRREFKANLKALIIWCVSFLMLMGLASTEFAVYQGQADEVNEFLNSLPEALRQAFSLDTVRLDIPEGYYSYLAGFMILASVIYAGLAGAQILSREMNKKTAETTFTLPVTRKRIISMKLMVAVLNCSILTAVTFAGSLAAFARFGIGESFVIGIGRFMLVVLALQLLFLLAGLFFSVLSKRHKRTGTIMASMIVGVYFLSFIAKLNESTEFLKYFTPFEYFPAAAVIQGHNLELFGFIVVPLLLLGFFTVSYRLVATKDL